MKGHLTQNVQETVKVSLSQILIISFKLITGLVIGLTFALVGEEIFGYGSFLFFFVVVVGLMVIWRLCRKWKFWSVVIFDLICVLVALLLRAYIVIAPGA